MYNIGLSDFQSTPAPPLQPSTARSGLKLGLKAAPISYTRITQGGATSSLHIPAHTPAGHSGRQTPYTRPTREPATSSDVTGFPNVNNILSPALAEPHGTDLAANEQPHLGFELVEPEASHGTQSLNDLGEHTALRPAISAMNGHSLQVAEATHTAPLGPSPQSYASTKLAIWPQLNVRQWIHHPTYALLYSATTRTALPNRLGARLTVPSALNLTAWDQQLKGYHDTTLCDYLRYGWPVGYTLPHPPAHVKKNHDSANKHPQHIRDFLRKEVQLGGILGPFSEPPFTPWVNTAPLMTRPKRESQARRVILDLSYPAGKGVNSGITKNCMDGQACNYTLPSITDLITRVQLLGRGTYLWKADLSRAFRQFRVDPQDIPLLGMFFEGQYYIDVCPSFGARLSSSACQRSTSAVVYLLRKDGHWALNYLDDFCGSDSTLSAASLAYDAIHTLCDDLGLKLADEKCAPPSQRMVWLGFMVDTNLMTVTIPEEKLTEVLLECRTWLKTRSALKKRVQSLAGKLIHLAKCIQPARKFMSRILASLRQAPETGFTPITAHFKQDVRWFLTYARQTNGVHLIDPQLVPFTLECDSSLEAGGGNSQTSYYQLKYNSAHKAKYTNITLLEATNIVTAYRTLVPQDKPGLAVTLYTDNMTSSYALQSGRTHNGVLAACARQLWLHAALNDHTITIVHKPGAQIQLADALSRPHIKQKRELADRLVREKSLTRLEPKPPHPEFEII